MRRKAGSPAIAGAVRPSERRDRTARDELGTICAAPVGELAAALPGAATLLRASGIGRCRPAHTSLAEAARAAGRDAEELAAGIAARAADAARTVPGGAPALISHVEAGYREEGAVPLPLLIGLAEKVAQRHGHRPGAPVGAAELLVTLQRELLDHIARKHHILYPLMRRGGHPLLPGMLAGIRREHACWRNRLRALDCITDGHAAPPGAGRDWRALCAGTGRLAEALVTAMYIEGTLLFPRFEPPAPRATPG